VVYAARPSASLPEETQKALRDDSIYAALFTSPRLARETIRLLRDAGLAPAAQRIIAIALSPRIATALSALPWAEIRAAAHPDHSALLACLGRADMLGSPL
jgi:uroporphyrinogen-III synthase